MNDHRRIAAGLCLLAAVEGCATRYLPPPAMPERVAPTVTAEATSPREGEGTVTLDAVGGAAQVEEVTERTQVTAGTGTGYSLRPRGTLAMGATQLTTRPLCVTPCTVNLPFGQHEMLFSSADPSTNRSSTAFITVGRQPSVARHAMGYQDTHIGGIVGALIFGALGFSGMLTGVALVAIGRPSTARETDLAPAGWTVLGVGTAMAVTAFVLGLTSRPEQQPGSTAQWTPGAP